VHHGHTEALVVESAVTDVEQDEYQFVEQLQKDVSKKKADMLHVKTLLHSTFNNRRKWIDNSTSADIPLAYFTIFT